VVEPTGYTDLWVAVTSVGALVTVLDLNVR
jgi:hypothetical protein